MKSKLNDAELIAEAYSQEVQEEGIGALAGGLGRVAGKVAKKGLKVAGKVAKEVGKEAAQVAKEVGGEGLRAAGKVAKGAAKTAYKGLDKAGQVADEAISKLTDNTEDSECYGDQEEIVAIDVQPDEEACGYDQVSEPEDEVNHADESEMNMALADLHKAQRYAVQLTELLHNVDSLEGWTAVKISKAADYLGSVFDKIDYDLNGHSMHNTGYEDAPVEDNQ